MKSRLKLSLIILATLFATSTITFPTSALSDTRAGAISMTCNSIKFTLRDLQKSDSEMRVSLGSKYENILSNFITNLNLRLVKNNFDASVLTSYQATFSSERNFFNHIFIEYSKSLEDLIAYDCQNDPYGFYDRLEITRAKREEVRASFLRLRDVLRDYRTTVEALKETL